MTDIDKILAEQRLGQEHFSLKEKIMYSIGGVLVFGGAFLLGRKMVRSGIAKNEEKKTFQEGSSATFAKQIKMAFENDGWPGTDEEKLRNVLRQVPSQNAMKDVAASYQRLYNSSLYKDMQDELQSTEYDEMLSIISAKPVRTGDTVALSKQYEEWAKRLNAAFNVSYGIFPGTDEDAIKAVFLEIPTQSAFLEVSKVYQQLYAASLIDDLKGELEFWEYPDYMAIITNKPK
jgi:hypothetical protein